MAIPIASKPPTPSPSPLLLLRRALTEGLAWEHSRWSKQWLLVGETEPTAKSSSLQFMLTCNPQLCVPWDNPNNWELSARFYIFKINYLFGCARLSCSMWSFFSCGMLILGCGCGIQFLDQGLKPEPPPPTAPVLGVWSLSHRIPREVPKFYIWLDFNSTA